MVRAVSGRRSFRAIRAIAPRSCMGSSPRVPHQGAAALPVLRPDELHAFCRQPVPPVARFGRLRADRAHPPRGALRHRSCQSPSRHDPAEALQDCRACGRLGPPRGASVVRNMSIPSAVPTARIPPRPDLTRPKNPEMRRGGKGACAPTTLNTPSPRPIKTTASSKTETHYPGAICGLTTLPGPLLVDQVAVNLARSMESCYTTQASSAIVVRALHHGDVLRRLTDSARVNWSATSHSRSERNWSCVICSTTVSALP